MKKILTTVAFVSIISATAFGQLIIDKTDATSFATSFRSNHAIVNTFINNPKSLTGGFSFNGLNFEVIDMPIDSIVVGHGSLGTFTANVSYITKESNDTNVFGVTNDASSGFLDGGTVLYKDYGPKSTSTSYTITSDEYELVNFWHFDRSKGFTGTKWQDDPLHFRWYQAIDEVLNRVYNIVAIDDRGSQLVDFNDGVFSVEWNLRPVSDDENPVPEASTYGLIGALGLLSIIGIRKISR